MRPGSSDTWLKAIFFAGLWVIALWFVLAGFAWFAEHVLKLSFGDEGALVLMAFAALLSIVAGRAHDSDRVAWSFLALYLLSIGVGAIIPSLR